MTILGSISFDDNAFADAVSLANGAPFDTNFSGLIGSSNQNYAGIGTINNSPDIEVRFTDNLIVNGEGVDLYIYVPGEVFAVNLSLTDTFSVETTVQAAAVSSGSEVFFDDAPGNPFGFNPYSILLAVDLDDLGMAEGDTLSTLYLRRGDIEGAIYGVGAVNSVDFDVDAPTAGGDVLNGTQFNDVINGLGGNDILRGRAGDDDLSGAAGDDVLFGAVGHDSMSGGAGDDTIRGDAGDDDLQGNSGDDTIIGGGGADDIDGGGDDDTIIGGNGRDAMNGGTGDDVMTGGGSADTFQFNNGFGDDRITDFSISNQEKIDLSAVAQISDFDDLLANHLSTEAGSGFAMITVGPHSLVLEGHTEADFGTTGPISAGDFVF